MPGPWGKDRCWEGIRQGVNILKEVREEGELVLLWKEETLQVTSISEGHVKGRLRC